MTVKQQYEIYLQHIATRKRNPVKGATLAAYASYWKNWICTEMGARKIESIENGAMKAFVAKLAQASLSASSIASITQVVKGIVASAQDDNGNELYPRKWNSDFIDAPIVDSRAQNAPVIDGKGVTNAISEASSQYVVLFALLAATGLRINEARALRVGPLSTGSYWDVEQSKLVIRTALYRGVEQTPKTTAGIREVDLAPELNDFLAAQLKNRVRGEYLFGEGGRPLRLRTAYDKAIAVGVPGFHSFRRFRITRLENTQVPRGLAMFWTGHAGKDVHDRYVKLDRDIEARKEWAITAGLGFDLPKRAHPDPTLRAEAAGHLS